MSAESIEKGSRWNEDIAGQLDETRFGLICLTSENLESPSILFEAGALSKAFAEQRYVWTFLYDLKPANISWPLAQFQHTQANRNDTKKLIETMNNALGDKGLSSDTLNKSFEKWWGELESQLNQLPAVEGGVKNERDERDILEEILALVREPRVATSRGENRQDLVSRYNAKYGVSVHQIFVNNYDKLSSLEKHLNANSGVLSIVFFESKPFSQELLVTSTLKGEELEMLVLDVLDETEFYIEHPPPF